MSYATKHIVEWCKEAPEIIKLECNSNMEKSKRRKKDNHVMAIRPIGTVSEELTELIVVAKNAITKKKITKQQKIVMH